LRRNLLTFRPRTWLRTLLEGTQFTQVEAVYGRGESVVEADTVELDNPSRTLVAKGHVRGGLPASCSPSEGRLTLGEALLAPQQNCGM